jgi:hypothetical protein
LSLALALAGAWTLVIKKKEIKEFRVQAQQCAERSDSFFFSYDSSSTATATQLRDKRLLAVVDESRKRKKK